MIGYCGINCLEWAAYCGGCEIRACAAGKQLPNCAACSDFEDCRKLHDFITRV